MSPRQATSDNDPLRLFALESARLLHDRKCEDVMLLDVRGQSQVCDYILIGSGTSDRQMKSVATELEKLGAEQGQQAFRTNRDTGATWIVTDFINLVVHLFEPQQRLFYDLESLWSDAPRLEWRRADQPRTAVTR